MAQGHIIWFGKRMQMEEIDTLSEQKKNRETNRKPLVVFLTLMEFSQLKEKLKSI